MPKQPKSSLLIIGAGITGLSVADALADEYAITILEAQDRLGGRIFTIGDHLEGGPEFIHGTELPYTMDLVKKAGATLEKCTGKWFRVSDCEWKEQEEEVEGWDELVKKIRSIGEDMTLDAFLETHFADPRYKALRHQARAFASGFDLADPVKASISSLGKEWIEQSEELYRIKEGYSALIHHLERQCVSKGCIIQKNKKIKQIDWQEDSVTAYTLNETFSGQKIVVTVPAGVLQRKIDDCSINFTPPMDAYEKAWENIGVGSVLKLLLRFKQPFWEQQQKEIGFILTEEAIPTWWTQYPSPLPILTGWIGGPSALQWNLMDDEDIIEQAMQSLARLFKLPAGQITELLESYHILKWSEVTTARGGYSYETPLSGQAIQQLEQPIANTVFFAGESLYRGASPGTVEAALASAAATVKKIRA